MSKEVDKIIRIQGDSLCDHIGLPRGTFIDKDLIERIAKAEL